MKRYKILIVEDELILADNIKKVLERHGYDIAKLAVSGNEALLTAKNEAPDLVIMDVVIKGELDGINTADLIRRQFGIPVIFLTAYSEDEIFQSAKITEPFGYITKPYEERQLIINIEMALYKHEIEKEKEKLIEDLNNEITSRKSTEESLKESEEFNKALFEYNPIETIVVDNNYRIVNFNRARCRMEGRLPQIGQIMYKEYANKYTFDMYGELIDSIKTNTVKEFPLLKYLDKYVSVKISPFKHGAIITFQDITERVKAEEELKKNELFFKDISMSMADWIWETDAKGVYTYCSMTNKNLLGYSPKEIIGKTPFDFMAPEEAKKIKKEFLKIVKNKAPIKDLENWNIKKDKSLVCLLTNGKPLFDDEGNLLGYRGVDKDITARKKAEQRLRESEVFIRTVMDNLPIGVAVNSVNPKVDFNYMNENFPKFYLTTKKALSDSDVFWDAVYENPEFRKEMKKRVLDDCATGDPKKMHWENIPIKRSGKGIRYINARNIPVPDKELMISTVWDVTERKRAEDEIISLSKFPSENPNPVLRMDAEGKILYNNEAVNKILKDEKLSKKHIYKILPKNIKSLIKEALKNNDTESFFEVQVGSKIFLYSLMPVIENKYVNLYGRDISKLKDAENQLIIHQRNLRSLASELSKTEEHERQRIATYLHDQISQSLAALRINIDEIIETKDISTIAKKARHVQSKLGKILEDSRTVTFDLSPPILHELGFEAAIEWIIEKMSEDYNIKIGYKNDPNPKPVEKDIGMFLYRSTKECLTNIIKHAKAKRIKVDITRDGDYIKIKIVDNGIGFDTMSLKNLIHPVGFGLFSIRERIEYIGGNLLIESKSGKGTNILLSVPILTSK